MAQKKVTLVQKTYTREEMAETAVRNGVTAILAAHPQTSNAHAAKLIGEAGHAIAFEMARQTLSTEMAAAKKPVATGLKAPIAPVLKPLAKTGKVEPKARKRA